LEPERSLTQKTLGGIVWMLSRSVLVAVIRLVVLVVLARILFPKDFGIVQAAMMVFGFAEIFSMMGIGPALIQFKVLNKGHIATGYIFSILLGIAYGLLVYFTAPLVGGFMEMPELTEALRLISVAFPISSVAIVSRNLLLRELMFRKLAIAEVFTYLIGYGVTGVVLALLGFGFWALVWANISYMTLRSITFVILQPFPVSIQLSSTSFKELINFGGGITMARVFNYIALKGDYLIIGKLLGDSELGIYGRSYNLMAASVTLFGQVLEKAIFSTMSKKQDEIEKLENAYQKGTVGVSLLILPTSIVSVILAPEIILVLLGPQWSGAIIPFQFLSVSMLFRVSYKMSGALAKSTGRVYNIAWRHAVFAVMVLILVGWGQQYGLAGASIGVSIAVFIHYLLMTSMSINYLPNTGWLHVFKLHLPAINLSIVVAILTGLVTYMARYLEIPALMVLILGLASSLVAVLLALKTSWALFLGKDGKWLLNLFIDYLPPNTYISKFLRSVIQVGD